MSERPQDQSRFSDINPRDALLAMLTTLMEQTHGHASQMAEVQRDVRLALEEVKTLTKILRDGNGQASLMVRVALMEKALAMSTDTLSEVRKAVESRATEDSKGKWAVVGNVVTGILAMIAAITAAIIAASLKR